METQDTVSGGRRGSWRNRGSAVWRRRTLILKFRGTLGGSNGNGRNSDTRGKSNTSDLRHPTDVGVRRDRWLQYNLEGFVDKLGVSEGNEGWLLWRSTDDSEFSGASGASLSTLMVGIQLPSEDGCSRRVSLSLAGLEPVHACVPRRISPTTVKDPINDLAEVERWSSKASEDVTAELVGSGDD